MLLFSFLPISFEKLFTTTIIKLLVKQKKQKMKDSPLSITSKAYLLSLGFVWSGYGLYCCFDPLILIKFAGMQLGKDSNPGFVDELRAMYGGCQMAFGLTAIVSYLKDKRSDGIATLRAYALVMFTIGLTRLLSLIQSKKSVLPMLSHRVLFEGLQVLLPQYYNSNAIWFFELPGGVAAYLCMKHEEEKEKEERTKRNPM